MMDEQVTLKTLVYSKTSQGQSISAYADVATIYVGIQPKSLTPDQIKLYGVSTLSANIKMMFFDKSLSISELQGIYRASGELYEVRGVNRWPNHGEALLFPLLSSDAETRFVLDADATPVNGVIYNWDDNSAYDDAQVWKD